MSRSNIYIYFLVTFFLLNTASLWGSNDERKMIADSVTFILSDTKMSDSLKVARVSELALINYFSYPNDQSSKGYIRKAIDIANRTAGYDSKVRAYAAAILFEDTPTERALMIDTCIKYIEKAKNPMIKSIGWQSIGYLKMGENESLTYFFNALDAIKGKGYWQQEQEVYQHISSFYGTKGDYSNQVKYAKLALKSAEKSNNDYDVADAWTNLGVAYFEIPSGDFLEDALNAFQTALDIYKKNIKSPQFKDNQYLYNIILINLGNVYFEKGQLDISLDYLNNALMIALKEKNKELQIDCYYRLSKIERARNNHKNAEKYLLKAIQILPQSTYDITMENSHLSYTLDLELATLYNMMGNYNDAVKYYKIGIDEYRKSHDAKMATTNQKLTANYEMEQKEQELHALQKTLSLKQHQSTLFIILSLIIVIGLLLLYYTQRYRIKVSKEREQYQQGEAKLVEMRKQQAELNAKLNAKESERLQKEVSAGSLLVDHKNKIFENLKLLFAQNAELKPYRRQLEGILMQETRIESNVEDYKSGLQDVHPDFYARLQEKADNKLTALDLKYCRLILLKVSSKEMAEQLHVDPKTIRVSKYRLKQKLKLSKEEDLNEFIDNIVQK